MRPTFQELLAGTEWTVDRCIDIGEYEKSLLEDGYKLNDVVSCFLKNYGGLYFSYPVPMLPRGKETFNFDPSHAVRHWNNCYIEDYTNEIQEELVIIGTCKREHMCLLMSHSGRFFAAWDDIFYLLGNDYNEGVENLINGNVLQSYDLPLD